MNSGKICISVCAPTAAETIDKLRRAAEFADVIEVRFDCLARNQLNDLRSQISNLRLDVPLLATYRSPDQGGHGNATSDEREDFWRSGSDGFFAGDFEENIFHSSLGWQNRIVSLHHFACVPSDIAGCYDRLMATEAEIIKIAVASEDIVDAIPIWNLLERSREQGRHIIPIAMGEAGKWTRILGLAYGAFLTYASLDEGAQTADGQMTARDLIDVYRVKELDTDTRVFGVIGDPVSQSLSPYFQNAAFREAGENAVFIHLLVKDLDEFIRRMVRPETREVKLNFGGFSITMPHKLAIMKHLDHIDPTAEKIGAVNTVKISDGKLLGYNTDAHGFVTPLRAEFGDLKGSRVALIGAGGSARACIYALKAEGADVTVFARDRNKASRFASEFGVAGAEMPERSAADSRQIVNRFDIVVNATPIGMKGRNEGESLFTSDELLGVKFVYDLVTKPADTPLISAAKAAGIHTIGGVEMLIAQGSKQFEIWTGREAPVELMRDTLVARMNR
ncbi:MAG: shikimate dehydrogenase [Pyrinomonadaceae bacterium]